MSRFEYFSKEELACRCGKCGLGEDNMSPIFMDKIIIIRTIVKVPLIVTSAVRCSEHNINVSKSGAAGPHTVLADIDNLCHSIDVLCFGHIVNDIVDLCKKVKITGIGLMQKGDMKSRYIHLDDLTANQKLNRPRPWLWTY